MVLMGSAALALGVLVYLADRDPARVLLMPAFAALDSGPLFGAPGLWLPSFLHPLAFSLFTAAALPRSAVPAYGACAAWWVVNVAFEVAQGATPSTWLAQALPRAPVPDGLATALSNFAVGGTFDGNDVLAATAGALVAAGLLKLIHQQESHHGL